MKRYIFTIILALYTLVSGAQNIYIHTRDEQTISVSVKDVLNWDADFIKHNFDSETVEVPDDQIWYVTSNGRVIDINKGTPFNANVISNTYENGYGIIRCDGPITSIGEGAFSSCNLTELYLPDCVSVIGPNALSNNSLRQFRVPKSLTAPDRGECYSPRYWGMFTNNDQLERFYGNHCSDDGRCLIIDGVLCGFAPKGLKEYSLPSDVKTIASYAFSFYGPERLEAINFNEGLEYISSDAFVGQTLLKSITLPNSLLRIDGYAFRGCTNVEGFYGNDNFHTPDNKCLLFEQQLGEVPNGKWICGFAGKGITEYTIPEGIIGIENYGMSATNSGGADLQKLTLPNSLQFATSCAFEGCTNLEAIYGKITSDDHRCLVTKIDGGMLLNALIARKNMPKEYHIPDNITQIGYSAFDQCNEIESITMGDQVSVIEGYAFQNCKNLKTVTLSAGLQNCSGYNLFLGSNNLTSVYLRSPLPPIYRDTQMQEFPNLTIYVPNEFLSLYQASHDWKLWREYFQPYDYGDISQFIPDYYYSSDYSHDGEFLTLQTANKGAGIDIVLMGDGYSDRQISDGTYQRDMQILYDNLFTEEPYRSFRDMFNVYSVNVVSMTEGLDYGHTALGTFLGEGTFVGGNDALAFEYAQSAIGEDRMDKAVVIVSMNKDAYAGTCFMYYPTSEASFGDGPSVCYFPHGGDDDTFVTLLHHEALGHGFAKLADEYDYEYMGKIPDDAVREYSRMQTDWGWYLNVDFTDDDTAVRWYHFIADERYAGEGIGMYEGAMTYRNGVWRSTENSIMRYNVGGFNAPSREAIFNRIHHLAYGSEWQPDHDAFMAYDAVNRTEAAKRDRIHIAATKKPMTPLHAPVVVAKTWREAETLTAEESEYISPSASSVSSRYFGKGLNDRGENRQ